MNKHNSGITIHLLISAILTLSIITTAILLNNMRTSILIPPTTRIKAYYQMESAIIMQLQQIKQGKEVSGNDFDIISKTVAPGVKMKLLTNRISPSRINFKAQIEGENYSKSMTAKAENNTSNLSPEGWKLSYIRENQ
jgi:hypothetical protein